MTYKDKEKQKAYKKAWYQAHKEEQKAYYQAHREERKAYRKAHKEERKAYDKAYNQAHREELKAYRKAHKEEQKAWYQAHKEEQKAYHNAWYKEHKEEQKAKFKSYYQDHKEERKAYHKADTNSMGQTKMSIRGMSRYYLFKVLKHNKLNGYQIHHCFGYDDYRNFIYIPKALHLKIHQFLRDNKIDADTDHYDKIVHLIIACEEYVYIKA